MRIRFLDGPDDDARWDAYVGARTWSVTDLSGWRLVARDAYGIRSHFLAAEREQLVGALALFEIRHPVFGHYLTTAAFGTDGGFHYDTEDARDTLAAEAAALARRLNVDYLLIRTRDLELDGFTVDRRYRTSVVSLEGGVEALWAKLPSKTRNQVRRGMKEGFTLTSGMDQLDAFFDVFHHHMRDLGSPAHNRRFYQSIANHLANRAEFVVVRDGNELAAGALLFRINGTAMNLHTVALRKFNTRCANYLLYWRMLEDSCARGDLRFDMGRSQDGTSNLRFKQNWATEELTLRYNYLLVNQKSVPYTDPRNPIYRLPIAIWRKLPLPLTKLAGPRLIAGLA